MPEPRTRLDQAMRARSLEIKKRWVQIAKEAGISVAGLGGLRRGEYKPDPHTARALEEAFRWEPGSIDAILAGGDPTPSPQRVPLPTAYETDQAGEIEPGRRTTADEVRESALQPETKEALLEIEGLVARWEAARDERAIRQARRHLRAIADEEDAG